MIRNVNHNTFFNLRCLYDVNRASFNFLSLRRNFFSLAGLAVLLLFSFSLGWQHRNRSSYDIQLQVDLPGIGEAHALDVHPPPFILLNWIPQMWWSFFPGNYWFPTCGGCIVQSFPYPWQNTSNVPIVPIAEDTLMQKSRGDTLVDQEAIVADTMLQDSADTRSRWEKFRQRWRSFWKRRNQEKEKRNRDINWQGLNNRK